MVKEKEPATATWRDEYIRVTGLYHDYSVKKTEKNIFYRDVHGNPIGIWSQRDYIFQIHEDVIEVTALTHTPMMNERSANLFAMLLIEQMVATGH